MVFITEINDNIQFDGNFSEETKQEIYQFLYSGDPRAPYYDYGEPCIIKLHPMEKDEFSLVMQYLFDRVLKCVMFFDRQLGRLFVYVEQYIPDYPGDIPHSPDNSGYIPYRYGLPNIKQNICDINRILISKDGSLYEDGYNIIVETDTLIRDIFPDYKPQNDEFDKLVLYTNSDAVYECINGI